MNNCIILNKNEKIKPIKDTIWIYNLQHGIQKYGSLIIPEDNMTLHGIRPRYAQIYAVADNLKHDFKKDDWVLLDHGEWSTSLYFKIDNKEIELHLVPKKSVYRGLRLIHLNPKLMTFSYK